MQSIHQATMQELEHIVPLFDAYRVFYGQPSDYAGARMFLQQRLMQKDAVIFILYENNLPVAFTQLYPIFSSVSMRPAFLLNDLYVDPSVRQKGYGAALLQRAADYGKQHQARWLLLSTAADNTTAQGVYEKNGWKKVSDIYYELPLE